MRPGYLAALASRTLGVAPVLQPATPSRFEPEGPQAELPEPAELQAAVPGPAASAWQGPARGHETAAVGAFPDTDRLLPGFFASDAAEERRPVRVAQDGWAAPGVDELAGELAEPVGSGYRGIPLRAGAVAGAFPDADRLLPGFFASDAAEERRPVRVAQDGWAAPGVDELAGEPAEPVGPGYRGIPLRAGAVAGAFPDADRLLPGFFASDAAEERRPVRVAQDDWAAPGVELAGEPAEPAEPGHRNAPLPATAATSVAVKATPPAGSRVSWQQEVIQTARSRQEAQAARRAGEPEAARSAEPAIVVRIGRVDVRAVQAAGPPAPAPRPRPAAGPSLAEHLLARDRRRR